MVFVAMSVLSLVAALVVVLLLAVGLGIVLFRRALDVDRTFTEILRTQHQGRQILTVRREPPSPPPLLG